MDFVNEGKLEDEIKRRQKEWERVRTKDDPIGNFKYLRKHMINHRLNAIIIILIEQRRLQKFSIIEHCMTSLKSSTK